MSYIESTIDIKVHYCPDLLCVICLYQTSGCGRKMISAQNSLTCPNHLLIFLDTETNNKVTSTRGIVVLITDTFRHCLQHQLAFRSRMLMNLSILKRRTPLKIKNQAMHTKVKSYQVKVSILHVSVLFNNRAKTDVRDLMFCKFDLVNCLGQEVFKQTLSSD